MDIRNELNESHKKPAEAQLLPSTNWDQTDDGSFTSAEQLNLNSVNQICNSAVIKDSNVCKEKSIPEECNAVESMLTNSLFGRGEIKISGCEVSSESHSEDKIGLKQKSTTENDCCPEVSAHYIKSRCFETTQQNSDTNTMLQNDNLFNFDSSLNQERITPTETKELNQLVIGSVDKNPSNNNYSSICSNLKDSENASSYRHKEANYILHDSIHDNSDTDPGSSKADVIIENDSCDYSKFVLNTDSSANTILAQADNFVVISNSNAIPQTEKVVPSNYSLAQLSVYGSDESLDGEPSTFTQQYREHKNEIQESDKESDSDSSSTSSSTSILISDSSDSESDDGYEVPSTPIKGKGEIDVKDLPPIQDLKISVPEEHCTPMGRVFHIVDQLVVVQALKDMPAYDLDTVLFVQGGQPLGKIFDVFGPVIEPYYCVRFNSRDHIREKNINLDQLVFSAPKTKHTKYVFLAQLMKLKGSDASWEDDLEPPTIYLDYSDDEQEQRAKKKRSRNRKGVNKMGSDPDEPARKRHFAYEKKMNERNLRLSAVGSHQSPSNNRAKSSSSLWARSMPPPGFSTSSPSYSQNVRHEMFGGSPMFNTTVPPPNFPFSVPVRQILPNINSPGRTGVTQSHLPRFINPNSSVHFPQALSPCRPGVSPGLSNNSGAQPYPFPPPQIHGPFRFAGNQSSNNTIPSWGQTSPQRETSWLSSPPPAPSRDSTFVNNNRLPSSTFWIQRPQTAPGLGVQTSFSALPNSPFPPPSLPPRPFWPTQSPPQANNSLLNNFSQVSFNPHLPPPSQNPFK